jgi:hypothetical protein
MSLWDFDEGATAEVESFVVQGILQREQCKLLFGLPAAQT